LVSAAGTFIGGRGFTWSGTGAWRTSTADFCVVGAAATLIVTGWAAEGAGAVGVTLATTGGVGVAA
jgi:hypothetical protein